MPYRLFYEQVGILNFGPSAVKLVGPVPTLKEQEQQHAAKSSTGIAKKTLKSFTTGRAIAFNLELT